MVGLLTIYCLTLLFALNGLVWLGIRRERESLNVKEENVMRLIMEYKNMQYRRR